MTKKRLLALLIIASTILSTAYAAVGGGVEYVAVNIWLSDAVSGNPTVYYVPFTANTEPGYSDTYVLDSQGTPMFSHLFSSNPPLVFVFDPSGGSKGFTVHYGGSNPYTSYTVQPSSDVFAAYDDFDSPTGMWVINGSSTLSNSQLSFNGSMYLNASVSATDAIAWWRVSNYGITALRIDVAFTKQYNGPLAFYIGPNTIDWNQIQDSDYIWPALQNGTELPHQLLYYNQVAHEAVIAVNMSAQAGDVKTFYIVTGIRQPEPEKRLPPPSIPITTITLTYPGSTQANITLARSLPWNTSIVVLNTTVELGEKPVIVAPHIYDWLFDDWREPPLFIKYPDTPLLHVGDLGQTWSVMIGYEYEGGHYGLDKRSKYYAGLVPGFNIRLWYAGHGAGGISDGDTSYYCDGCLQYTPQLALGQPVYLTVIYNMSSMHISSYTNMSYYTTYYVGDKITGSIASTAPLVIGASPYLDNNIVGRIYYTVFADNNVTSAAPWQLLASIRFLGDASFFDGLYYRDAVNLTLRGTPNGLVKRVPARTMWLWRVTPSPNAAINDTCLHLRWFPAGTVVAITGPLNATLTILGPREASGVVADTPLCSLPPGSYSITAKIPLSAWNPPQLLVVNPQNVTTSGNAHHSGIEAAMWTEAYTPNDVLAWITAYSNAPISITTTGTYVDDWYTIPLHDHGSAGYHVTIPIPPSTSSLPQVRREYLAVAPGNYTVTALVPFPNGTWATLSTVINTTYTMQTVINITDTENVTLAPHLYKWVFHNYTDYVAFMDNIKVEAVTVYINMRLVYHVGTLYDAGIAPHIILHYLTNNFEAGITNGTKAYYSGRALGPINTVWHIIGARWGGPGTYIELIVDGSTATRDLVPTDFGLGNSQAYIGDKPWNTKGWGVEARFLVYYANKTNPANPSTPQDVAMAVYNITPTILADPTFYNGSDYFTLGDVATNAKPSGATQRIPDTVTWLWALKQAGNGAVHLKWFPVGSIVEFYQGDELVKKVTITGTPNAVGMIEDYVVIGLPAGTYTVKAYIPRRLIIAPHLYDWYFNPTDGTRDYIYAELPDMAYPCLVDASINVRAKNIGFDFNTENKYYASIFRFLAVRASTSNLPSFGGYIEFANGTTFLKLHLTYGTVATNKWYSLSIVYNRTHLVSYVDETYNGSLAIDYSLLTTYNYKEYYYYITIGGWDTSYGQFWGYLSYAAFTVDDTYVFTPQEALAAWKLSYFFDPTFYNGTTYLDLISEVVGVPYGNVQRVLADNAWLWIIDTGPAEDGKGFGVYLDWFPMGSRILVGGERFVVGLGYAQMFDNWAVAAYYTGARDGFAWDASRRVVVAGEGTAWAGWAYNGSTVFEARFYVDGGFVAPLVNWVSYWPVAVVAGYGGHVYLWLNGTGGFVDTGLTYTSPGWVWLAIELHNDGLFRLYVGSGDYGGGIYRDYAVYSTIYPYVKEQRLRLYIGAVNGSNVYLDWGRVRSGPAILTAAISGATFTLSSYNMTFIYFLASGTPLVAATNVLAGGVVTSDGLVAPWLANTMSVGIRADGGAALAQPYVAETVAGVAFYTGTWGVTRSIGTVSGRVLGYVVAHWGPTNVTVAPPPALAYGTISGRAGIVTSQNASIYFSIVAAPDGNTTLALTNMTRIGGVVINTTGVWLIGGGQGVELGPPTPTFVIGIGVDSDEQHNQTIIYAMYVWREMNTTRYLVRYVAVPGYTKYVVYGVESTGIVTVDRFAVLYGAYVRWLAQGLARMSVSPPYPVRAIMKYVSITQPVVIQYVNGQVIITAGTKPGLTLMGFKGWTLSASLYGASTSDQIIPSDEFTLDVPTGFTAMIIIDPVSRNVGIVTASPPPPTSKSSGINPGAISGRIVVPTTTKIETPVTTTIMRASPLLIFTTMASIAIALYIRGMDIGVAVAIVGLTSTILMLLLGYKAEASAALIAVAIGLAWRLSKK